jgi:hypothetical protein
MKFFYLFATFLFLIGGWYTGSRQVLFTLVFTQAASLLYLAFLGKKDKVINIAIISLTIVSVSFFLVDLLTSANFEAYTERFTSDTDGGNQKRMYAWALGVEQLSIANLQKWFVGNGFTYTMGQYASPGEKVGYHMESSVWAMFAEIGLFSWYVFFWPLGYSFYLMSKLKTSLFKILIFSFLISFTFTSFISPNASNPLSTMCLFIILGFLISQQTPPGRGSILFPNISKA